MSEQLTLLLTLGQRQIWHPAGPTRFRAVARVLKVAERVEMHWRLAADRQRIFYRVVRSRAPRQAEDFVQRIGVSL